MDSRLQKITKARAALITAQPFYGSLALRLVPVEVGADVTRTMATDGVRLCYNGDYLDGLTAPELQGVIAHEVTHCALDHIGRLAKRDHARWNQACDYAINPLLIESGFTLPKGALVNPRFAGKSADEIYNLLPASQDGQGQGKQPGAGQGQGGQPNGASGPENAPGCGDMILPENQSPADAQRLAEEWTIATVQAANAARGAGKLPGGLKRLVDGIKQPQIDWREAFRKFVASSLPSDYAWFPPNRRHVAAGLYLPSLVPDVLGHVAVMIDTSGSIDGATLAAFAAELNAILEDARPNRVTVIYCDAAVNSVRDYAPDDYPVTLTAQGGGGTDFRPPFAWLEDHDIRPALAVYLTDLDAPAQCFPAEPDYPVLWVTTDQTHAPFGDVVKIVL